MVQAPPLEEYVLIGFAIGPSSASGYALGDRYDFARHRKYGNLQNFARHSHNFARQLQNFARHLLTLFSQAIKLDVFSILIDYPISLKGCEK